ncbi:MAG: hypothetical protein M3Q44_08095 [bacterium]|nr:hypothetical protein [bacterium]
MGSADYDLMLQEIRREHKRTGLDKSGYVFEHSDSDAEPIHNEHDDDQYSGN